MRPAVSLISIGLVALAGTALAANPLAKFGEGYTRRVESIAGAKVDDPPKASCENGEERDDAGTCPNVDDSTSTRGFTLFSGSAMKPKATAPSNTANAMAAREMRPAAATETLKCGAVCDLKVTFKTGSTELTAESEAKLSQFAAGLRDPSTARRRYEIGGHTDASGSPEKNLSLSQTRAEVVKSFLVAHGIPSARLEAKGYGAEDLVLPNAPNDPRNRRVEARLLN
jgi:outer membrane protein OmpA-like peptidoglycan-associated protein